ncbi:signal peptide peptidase-domain-containing protein [Aspergillus heterothallicus]
MAEVSRLAELLAQAIYHFNHVKPLLPTYGHVILSALFPLYIGAHASLSRPSCATKPPKSPDKDAENQSEDDEDENGDEAQDEEQKMEGLAPSDALVFPLTAGATLGGLYLVIKWMGADTLNKVLGFYFSQMGIFFAMAFIKDALSVLRSFLFPRRYTRGGKVWKPRVSDRVFAAVQPSTDLEPLEARPSPLPGIFGLISLPDSMLRALWTCRDVLYWRARLRFHVHRLVHLESSLGTLDVLSVLVALPAVIYFTFFTKPWWLTNFLGFSFCYGTLQLMSPSTFVTGSLILGSLFFYDIYFVYFTPLMVTVAKNLDVPIKLLFPRPPGPMESPDTVSLAMLGLGDIIVPGMMVGLALRFDLYLHYKRKGMLKAEAEGENSGFIKPVFQQATGGWGERFWAPPTKSNEPQLEIPYQDARSFPKHYFKASLVGYTIGMVTTLAVMQIFDHAQPALLYLVPGILISLWGTALLKGQVHEMWEFSEGEEDEEDTSEQKDDADQKDAAIPDKRRGLFARLFSRASETTQPQNPNRTSNEYKRDIVKAKNAAGDDEQAHGQDESSPEADVKEDLKHLDIFSFSIYVPHKAKPSRTLAEKSTIKSNPGEENWAYVGGGKQDIEPPAKRRRRSPRKFAAESQ